jgi:DNA-binding MarR family transcriptional regulator
VHTSSGDEVERVVSAWRRERPDVDVSSIGIVLPILRLASSVAEARATVLAAHGLDQSHLDVLSVLRRNGPPYRLGAGELSRRCRVTPGATTQRVQAMEAEGLVERVREDPDRRTVHVQLTEPGLRRLDEVFGDVVAADESLLAGLTPAQRRALEEALRGWLDVVHAGAWLG